MPTKKIRFLYKFHVKVQVKRDGSLLVVFDGNYNSKLNTTKNLITFLSRTTRLSTLFYKYIIIIKVIIISTKIVYKKH